MGDYDIILVQVPLLAKEYSEPEELEFYDKYWGIFGRVVERDMFKVPIYDVKELPLWIAALGATLEQNDMDVRVLDLSPYGGVNVDYEAIRKELETCSSPVFALSSFTNNFSVCVKISKLIKDIFGESATVVVGGAHASNTAELCLMHGSIDIVCRGEGERAIPDIVKCIKNGKPISQVCGISWKKEDGGVVHNPAASTRILPDELPLPAYHLIPQTYRGIISFARIYTSRGCAYNCAYCADTLWSNRKPIHQTLERTLKQVEAMHNLFDIDLFYVGDESFTYNKSYVQDFGSEMIKRNFKWISQTRTDLITPEILNVMKESNCKLIKFGAESANQHLLNKIRKGITVESIRKACYMAKSAGLNVLLYWMVGLPDESRETAENTIQYAENLFNDKLIDLVEYYITTPYPGTDLYANPNKYNIEIIGKDFDEWREDRPSVTNTQYLSRDEIFQIWKQGLSRFAKCMEGLR
ncbi:radical SAM protein [Heliobacterium gestii]|uniref:Radical SAM protein n=1 Tax=Heliomicrobium gestii TaxID=2699 RepID=A0A845L6G7_HELGE|nr:radical SAM protein [Heliomicrobium gestii]MBM7865557.1 radical SAM superfamily enzyme YgiQ (UPF0313 family) [Heliomicrobium gestii]MZP41808.1 radical SAM protein [Heliomicrobium gestii]